MTSRRTHFLFIAGAAILFAHARAALDPTTMAQHLSNGAGILGEFSTEGSLTDWMAVFDDSIPLVSMNIPGTHDSCAWVVPGIEHSLLQCQDVGIFDQLNGGIRFFDIRFGSNNGTLQLYHADFLLDTNATLEDVLWGFYKFLEVHPTETVILSLKVDSGDTTADLQSTVNTWLTSSPTSDYWVLDATLPTLGDARGKAVLFRRYSVPPSPTPFGLNVSLSWVDNNASFGIATAGETVWVEDLYELDLANTSIILSDKFAAFSAHVTAAAAPGNETDLFVSFASGGGALPGGYDTPRTLATGDPDSNVTGINNLALAWLQQQPKGARGGVMLYDFFESEPGLVLATIASDKVVPNKTATPTTSASVESSTSPPNGAMDLRPFGISTWVLGLVFATMVVV